VTPVEETLVRRELPPHILDHCPEEAGAERILERARSTIYRLRHESAQRAHELFREGSQAGEVSMDADTPAKSPYVEGTFEDEWWTRGLTHFARLARAIRAEMLLKGREPGSGTMASS
jgi:hypothetical protein